MKNQDVLTPEEIAALLSRLPISNRTASADTALQALLLSKSTVEWSLRPRSASFTLAEIKNCQINDFLPIGHVIVSLSVQGKVIAEGDLVVLNNKCGISLSKMMLDTNEILAILANCSEN